MVYSIHVLYELEGDTTEGTVSHLDGRDHLEHLGALVRRAMNLGS
jgi:hypothetical protein